MLVGLVNYPNITKIVNFYLNINPCELKKI